MDTCTSSRCAAEGGVDEQIWHLVWNWKLRKSNSRLRISCRKFRPWRLTDVCIYTNVGLAGVQSLILKSRNHLSVEFQRRHRNSPICIRRINRCIESKFIQGNLASGELNQRDGNQRLSRHVPRGRRFRSISGFPAVFVYGTVSVRTYFGDSVGEVTYFDHVE